MRFGGSGQGVRASRPEGGERTWNAQVIELGGEGGHVTAAVARRVEGTSSRDLRAIEGSEFELQADLVLVAIGFNHPEQGLLDAFGLDKDARGNVRAPVFESSAEGVFACGDARIGQSLVVTAIAEGRKCARIVDRYLEGREQLPAEDPITAAHFIEIQARTAGTVVAGDDFRSGPDAS